MNQILNQNQKIAFIQADWHADIVGQGRESFIQHLVENSISKDQVEVFTVAGVLEIPLQAQKLAQTGNYAAIAAGGLVVNGGMYRHDFVGQSVIDGIMRVQLDTGIPILSMVLTPHHFHEHEEHHKFFYDHFTAKGKEVANACLITLDNMSKFAHIKQAV